VFVTDVVRGGVIKKLERNKRPVGTGYGRINLTGSRRRSKVISDGRPLLGERRPERESSLKVNPVVAPRSSERGRKQ